MRGAKRSASGRRLSVRPPALNGRRRPGRPEGPGREDATIGKTTIGATTIGKTTCRSLVLVGAAAQRPEGAAQRLSRGGFERHAVAGGLVTIDTDQVCLVAR
jgi:hypothetical protein